MIRLAIILFIKDNYGIVNLWKIATFAPQLHRGMEQLVARRAHNPKVAGSSPAPAT